MPATPQTQPETVDSILKPGPHEPPFPRNRLIEIRDACLGRLERCRDFPSDRASSELLAYYEGLYQERGPNPNEFRVLLRRNGRPFLSNPFPEGQPEHYLYHPDGLVMADLEAILGSLANQWGKPSSTDTDAPEGKILKSQYEWPSIYEADRARQQDILETEEGWSRLAGVCWAMVLLEPGSLEWLQSRVHGDNLSWATVQALRASPMKEWGVDPALVVSAAINHRILPVRVARELFPQWADSQGAEGPNVR